MGPDKNFSLDAKVLQEIKSLPLSLQLWEKGESGLIAASLLVALSRQVHQLESQINPFSLEMNEVRKKWSDIMSTLVDWFFIYSKPAPTSAVPLQLSEQAVDLARNWRVFETLTWGIKEGSLALDHAGDGHLYTRLCRRIEVEVLDQLLEEVTTPPNPPEIPKGNPADSWLRRMRGTQETSRHFSIPPMVASYMWSYWARELEARGSRLSDETDLGGFSLAEGRLCYAYLIAQVHLRLHACAVLGGPEPLLWLPSKRDLIDSLAIRCGSQVAEAFVRTLSAGSGRSSRIHPIVPLGRSVLIPGDLVTPTGVERTLLRAAGSDPSATGKLGRVLGNRVKDWSTRLRVIPEVRVAEGVKLKDARGKTLGDLDVVALDPVEKFAMVFEVKWPIDASTLAEGSKVDAAFEAGAGQLQGVRDAIRNGAEIQWPRSWSWPEDVEISWWVASAQQLYSRSTSFPSLGTTSLRLVEHVLPVERLRDLDSRLRNFSLPELGKDFRMHDEVVALGAYTLHFPAIELLVSGFASGDKRVHKGWV